MHKKPLIIASLLVILAAVPATLLLSEKPQETRSRATASTTLSFAPNSTESAPLEKSIGDTVDVDVMVNPGSNLPSLVKLELAYDTDIFNLAATPFSVNQTAFPTKVEGPIISGDKVLISVSIGSDSTKAIQVPTKVGTLHLIAKTATNGTASQVSFGTRSQVLSLAENDEASENVLSTTSPSYVTIVQSGDQTPTATPSATVVPTTLPTISSTPTPTTSTSSTTFLFDLYIHGIGSSGDNANPNASDLSNKDPKTPSRNITVYIFNAQNQLVASESGTAVYASASGSFKGSVAFNIAPGNYTMRLKEDLHLRRQVPGIQQLGYQASQTMPPLSLVAGDVNNDNILNILDYNTIVGCYSDLLPPTACDDAKKVVSDLTDDGTVNQFDYNLFLREITVQSGN